MIDLEKELGIFSMEEIMENTEKYKVDEYTGKEVFEFEKLYKTHIFLNSYDDSDEIRELFHLRMVYHNFPPNIAII